MDNELKNLREKHSALLASASDLDLDLPEDLVVEFYKVQVGQQLCKRLHDFIEKNRHTARSKSQEASMAKKAKKKVAKKGAKKAAKTRAARTKFEEGAKITVLSKENPCREGNERHARVAAMLKSGGKTVGKAGIRTSTLKFGIDHGLISVG